MSDPADPPPSRPAAPGGVSSRQVRVRRGPKVPVFIVVGIVLGVLVAAVLIAVTPKDPTYSSGQAFGFVALVLATIGAAAGGAAAVLFDRLSIRRARIVTAERARERSAPRIGDPGAFVPDTAAEEAAVVDEPPIARAPGARYADAGGEPETPAEDAGPPVN